MRESRLSPLGANTFDIYIDKAAGGDFCGRIAGGSAPAGSSFTSLTKMILLLDEYLDLEHPVAQPAAAAEQPDFELEVLFRQNYSWQGRLRWLPGGKEAIFHSVLELIFILETILAQMEN